MEVQKTLEALELIAELAPMLEAGTIEDIEHIEHHIRLLSETATVVAAELKMRTIDAANPNYECLERSRELAYKARNGEEIGRGVMATAIFEVLDLGSHECGEKNRAQSQVTLFHDLFGKCCAAAGHTMCGPPELAVQRIAELKAQAGECEGLRLKLDALNPTIGLNKAIDGMLARQERLLGKVHVRLDAAQTEIAAIAEACGFGADDDPAAPRTLVAYVRETQEMAIDSAERVTSDHVDAAVRRLSRHSETVRSQLKRATLAQPFNGAPKDREIWVIVPMRWDERRETFVDREGDGWSEEVSEGGGEYSFFLGWMPAGEKVGDA